MPLKDLVLEPLKLSNERFEELVSLGAIYVDRCRQFNPAFSIPVKSNRPAVVRVHTKPKRYDFRVEDIEKRLVANEKDFVVFNKPAKLPSHATVDNWNENLLRLGSQMLGTELHITHRLDRETEGLILLAKTKTFQNDFNQLLRDRTLEKIYWCEVGGGKAITPGVYSQELDGKNCSLEVLACHKVEDSHHLLIQLETGRTHQIRRQLQLLGAPILGDEKYGENTTPNASGQMKLEACRLQFKDKSAQVWSFETSRFRQFLK